MLRMVVVDLPNFSEQLVPKTATEKRYTLRLHRRSREIAGFPAATLPGLEH